MLPWSLLLPNIRCFRVVSSTNPGGIVPTRPLPSRRRLATPADVSNRISSGSVPPSPTLARCIDSMDRDDLLRLTVEPARASSLLRGPTYVREGVVEHGEREPGRKSRGGLGPRQGRVAALFFIVFLSALSEPPPVRRPWRTSAATGSTGPSTTRSASVTKTSFEGRWGAANDDGGGGGRTLKGRSSSPPPLQLHNVVAVAAAAALPRPIRSGPTPPPETLDSSRKNPRCKEICICCPQVDCGLALPLGLERREGRTTLVNYSTGSRCSVGKLDRIPT
jgi:hypothetical protein